uniref:NADH dehydrogenase subunit 6 n=1 Tax=Cacopsylla melanoneura TaxID=428564 RepID=A0A8D9E6L9_9HEMI
MFVCVWVCGCVFVLLWVYGESVLCHECMVCCDCVWCGALLVCVVTVVYYGFTVGGCVVIVCGVDLLYYVLMCVVVVFVLGERGGRTLGNKTKAHSGSDFMYAKPEKSFFGKN